MNKFKVGLVLLSSVITLNVNAAAERLLGAGMIAFTAACYTVFSPISLGTLGSGYAFYKTVPEQKTPLSQTVKDTGAFGSGIACGAFVNHYQNCLVFKSDYNKKLGILNIDDHGYNSDKVYGIDKITNKVDKSLVVQNGMKSTYDDFNRTFPDNLTHACQVFNRITTKEVLKAASIRCLKSRTIGAGLVTAGLSALYCWKNEFEDQKTA